VPYPTLCDKRHRRSIRKRGSKEPPLPNLDPADYPEVLNALTAISIAAANAIKGSLGGVRIKADGSPVTSADEAAEAVIADGLTRLGHAFPVVSEESSERATVPAKSDCYFLVDPLDGTKEFIAGRDEYTVNIALLSEGTPVLGVITAPALGIIWRGAVGAGAERLEFVGEKALSPLPIHSRSVPAGEFIVVVSRSHLDAPTEAYLQLLPHTRRIGSGSSLKFCRLAEGVADHYPRLGPTMDWDIAAGHAVLTAAGGVVTELDGSPLKYGTPDLRIPSFLAWGDPTGAQRALDG
jgi:3'(2'), 5'-bisphosphate nucleotidase